MRKIPAQELNFHELSESIKANYSLLQTDKPSCEHVIMDLVESWEEMNRLLPMLDSIVGKRCKERNLRKELIGIETRAWHLSEHILRLQKGIAALLES